MKKILFILLCLFFITGCQEYNELNDLAIIKSIGIKKDGEYTLYAEIIEEIEKDNNPKTNVIETKGKQINDLFENVKTLTSKEIYLSHIDLLLLDTNLKDSDYQNIINYFLEHKEFRNDFLTVLSKDIKKVLDKAKYDEIEKLITTNRENKNIIKISFEEIMKSFLDHEPFYLSEVDYNNKIIFNYNYQYFHNNLERMTYEKKEN